jgi:hypothetical protein
MKGLRNIRAIWLLPAMLVASFVLLNSWDARAKERRDAPTAEVHSGGDPEFRVIVPRFASDGEGQLGFNVAFALNHEIFRDFNFSIPAREDGRFDQADECCLRYGAVSILHGPLFSQTHKAADEFAKLNQAQLVLWGKAWPYGPDVVVQPFLTVANPPSGMERPADGAKQGISGGGIILDVPFDDEGRWSLWQIDAERDAGPPARVRLLGFPGSRYEMSPIVFDEAKLKLFSSFDGMPVYKEKSESSRVEGRTGNKIVARQHAPGGWSKIVEPAGWIRLPDLDAADTVDFVGGLVHFMRGNWKRARVDFEQVMNAEAAPTRVRLDAALLLAATLYRLDPDCSGCEEPIGFARDLNPYSRITARYSFMASLARARNSGDAALWQDVRTRLERIASYSPEDDPFLRDAREVLDILQGQGGAAVVP